MRRWPDPLLLLIVGLSVAGGVLGVRALGGLQALELRVGDLLTRLQASAPDTRPLVLVIAATEADVRARGWPLPDAVLADALGRLQALSPVVVGVDIYRDLPVRPGTDRLAALLRAWPAVVWVTKFGGPGSAPVAPPAALADTGRHGFADVLVDPDGVVRRVPLFLDDGARFDTAFALTVAARLLAEHGIALTAAPAQPDWLAVGGTVLPPLESGDGPYRRIDDRGYQLALDYAAGARPAAQATLSDLLDGRLTRADVVGRAVLIGTRAQTVKDSFETPFSAVSDAPANGVDLHAVTVDQLLRHGLHGAPPIRQLPGWLAAAWILAAGALGALAGGQSRGLGMFAGTTALLLAGQGGVVWALSAPIHWTSGFWTAVVWTPAAPASIATALGLGLGALVAGWRQRAERAALMALFSRHLSPAVAERIWQQRDAFLDGGVPRPQQLTATILFADIRGFTAIVERYDQSVVIAWLNAYMRATAEVVAAEGGIVDKFVGDAVMAVFGVPVPRLTDAEIRADAQAAARSALAIRDRLDALNRDWAARGWPTAAVRVGLHTGLVTAGSLGSGARLEYTVIGDTVNVAARLEQAAARALPDTTAAVGCAIALSAATRAHLDSAFETRPLGPVDLKGKVQPTPAYALVGRAAPSARRVGAVA